jgi:hypothetical protein
MNINTRNLDFVNFNSQEMEWVKFNGVTVYEAWKKLIANGVPPITLQKCKGVDLVDYKIYGESINGENLFVIKSDYTYTSSGITMTSITGNSYFTLNGTATTTTSGRVAPNLGLFEKGTYSIKVVGLHVVSSILDRILVTNANDGTVIINNITVNAPQTFTLEEDTELRIQYVVASGSTYDNKKIRVSITKVPDIEEPVEILSVGDKTSNIFNMAENVKSETKNGLTITYSKEEDCIILNGTTTNVDTSYGAKYFNIPNISGTSYGYGIFYVSGTIDKPSGKYASAYFGQSDNGTSESNWKAMGLPQDTDATYVATCDKNYIRGFWIWISAGVTFNNYKIRVQLEKSTEKPTSYDAYNKYKIPVRVSGKNLINIKNSEVNKYINSSGGIGTSSGYGLSITEKINVKPNTAYVYSGMGNVGGSTVMRSGYQYDKDGNPLKVIKVSSGEAIGITTEPNCAYVILQYIKTEEKPMLEKSSVKTDYEPYMNETTNIYLDEPLRKIGNYADYIDFEKQKVIRNIVEHTTDATEPWTFSTLYTNHISFYAAAYRINGYGTTGNSGRLNILSDKLPTANLTTIECVKCTGEISTETSGLINITILKSRIGYETTDTNAQAVEKLKNWLANNPMTFVYAINKFAEPIEEEIELPNIPTHKGTNIIEIDTDILPSNMEVKYYGKGGVQLLDEITNNILNEILNDNTETEKDISDIEIEEILDEIIGG